jgi:hypothetical protein
MGPYISLLSSYKPATALCCEPDESNPQILTVFLRVILILFSHLRLDISSLLFPYGFPI